MAIICHVVLGKAGSVWFRKHMAVVKLVVCCYSYAAN